MSVLVSMYRIHLVKNFEHDLNVPSTNSASVSLQRNSKFYLHVNMTMPVSELFSKRYCSNLLVFVSIESRAECTPRRYFGNIGNTFLLSRYRD